MKTAVILILACALLMVSHVTVEAGKLNRELRLQKKAAEQFLNGAPHKIVKRDCSDEPGEKEEEDQEESN